MRRLSIIPVLLFGLLFVAGGYFILAETALPMWRDWQRMQDWRPTNARLLSVTAADNDTGVDYRYDYAGASYRGRRLGVSEIKDNIGPYHADMQAYLRRIERNDEPLPIWVNPANPAQAVIDRDMRWGLFALSVGFCSVFLLIGLGVIIAGIASLGKGPARRRPSLFEMRKAWQQARADGATEMAFVEYCQQQYAGSANSAAEDVPPADWRGRKGWEHRKVTSDAARGTRLFWFFAVAWNAISTPLLFVLPDELERANYAALAGLLFPAVGLFLLYLALKRTLEYRRFGNVVYSMDPYPGAIGGHVGGHIHVGNLDYRRASEASSLLVRLECVYSYMSGSGDKRSRRESIKWAEQGKPKIDRAAQGVKLVFRFDVPENLPQADVDQSGAYHFWRLGVKADIPGLDLDRSYNIPVIATAATSQHSHHDISAQAASARARASDAARLAIGSGRFEIDGLSRAMRYRNEGNRIRLAFPMFRNKLLTLIAAIFAGGFGFASYGIASMAEGGGIFGIFMAVFGLPFFLVALLAAIAAVYLSLNNLRVSIEHGEVSVVRRLLFIPIYRRVLRRADISHLDIKRSGSTGQGVDKVEHFKIRAQDREGRHVTLAEDIDGEDVAMHFHDYLAQRIGVAAR